MRLLALLFALLLPGEALAQRAPDPLVTAFQVGIQTGQQVAAMAADANEKLKWWSECVKNASCVEWVNSAPEVVSK